MASSFSRRAFLGTAGAAGASIPLIGTAVHASPTAPRRNLAREPLPSERQGFNRRWWAPNLEAVFAPANEAEAVVSVQEGLRRYGRNVKVVSGRHCYEGFAYNSSTRAIIDMAGVCTAGYDRERRAYYVDAGAELWTAYRTLLTGYGVTLPAGSCYSVGAGGHIAGGGYGLLSRAHGLTIDHVTAIDIVTWDSSSRTARLRHVSRASRSKAERDLFWALRGAGGGNFGVITRFWFDRLPAAPAWATIWNVDWDWSSITEADFSRLLASYAEWVDSMPDRHFALLGLQHVQGGSISMTYQVASTPRAGLDQHLRAAERAIAQARDMLAIKPSDESTQHLTYFEAVQTLNDSGPNAYGKYKSAYMRSGFPEDQVAALYAGLRTVPAGVDPADMGASVVQVDSYGGAINRIPSTATALPQRSSILKLQFQTYWSNAAAPGRGSSGAAGEQSAAHLEWIDGIYRDVYAAYGGTPDPSRDPAGVVAGCYYNYPDADLGTRADGRLDQALHLYFLGNRQRLTGIKSRWDPDDYFHHAQSIPVG